MQIQLRLSKKIEQIYYFFDAIRVIRDAEMHSGVIQYSLNQVNNINTKNNDMI